MTIARQPVDIKNLKVVSLKDPSALEGFSCGEAEIDRNISKCCGWHKIYSRRMFCGFLSSSQPACGFYCIGMWAHESKYLDREIFTTSSTANYVPFIYLNYLAVSLEYQNNGIGTILLMHALARCAYVVRNIGVPGVALNALTDRSAGLYNRYGFREHGEGRYPFMVLPALSLLDLFP